MKQRFDSILDTVGGTPVVRLNHLAPHGVNVYVKIEAFNPMGSVKDRLALGVIEAAERDGSLTPGQTVIEATSGNTGIGLAMVCAAKGYPLIIVMAENFSVERRRLMRFLGAKVVLTPASEKGTGMVRKAGELAAELGGFLPRQFENEANAEIHATTTAPEILSAFAGETLDYWVTGAGTGGTLKGVARVLRDRSPSTKIVVCEPDNSAILSRSGEQQRRPDGSAAASHPAFRPHAVQGWTPDFVAKLAGDAVDAGFVDEIVPVTGDEAIDLSRELARREGIFCGISSGATLAGALRIAQKAKPGANILVMLPDTGERYLSTPLFEDVAADMTAEETALSQSTPSCRFDRPAVAPAKPVAEAPAVDAAARETVGAMLSDTEQPVVFFALQWCEFCWSVRRFFKAAGIDYRSVDLDGAAYRDGDLGGRVRAALAERIGSPTIPQIFVGGVHVGGATETFDAFNDGTLYALLDDAGVAYDETFIDDAYGFLPPWLQKRGTTPSATDKAA